MRYMLDTNICSYILRSCSLCNKARFDSSYRSWVKVPFQIS
jgi:hypothetical protein